MRRLDDVKRLGDLLENFTEDEARFLSDFRTTGYTAIDTCGGLRSGDLILVASCCDFHYPDFSLQLIESVAIKERFSVLHIRVGKDVLSLVCTWLCRTQAYEWCLPFRRNDGVSDATKHTVQSEAPIYVLDAHGYTFEELELSVNTFAKYNKSGNPLGLIVIDSIEELNIWGTPSEASKAARWANISSNLKFMAEAHRCPVVANVWLPYLDEEGSVISSPGLRHLPNDGALACSADVVWAFNTSQADQSWADKNVPTYVYTIYDRRRLYPGHLKLRYEGSTCRWIEVEQDSPMP